MHASTCLAITAVFLTATFSAPTSRAAVYRCLQDDGHVSYQQIPCSNESRPMELKDRRSGWSSLRPGEQALLNSYRKEDAARSRKPSSAGKKPARETTACWNKRKQLEAVRSKLRRGYKLKEGDELHRKRDNYEDYLRQFCS